MSPKSCGSHTSFVEIASGMHESFIVPKTMPVVTGIPVHPCIDCKIKSWNYLGHSKVY